MYRTHRILLQPTKAQEVYFRKASGVSRHAYNWSLSWWQTEYNRYKKGERPSAPSGNEAIKTLNSIKKEQFPWYFEVSARCAASSVRHLDKSFRRFFSGQANAPKFKTKKSSKLSFTLGGAPRLKFKGKKVFIEKCGWVRMSQPLRFSGKAQAATVFFYAGKWYISIPVLLDEDTRRDITRAPVGVDVGVREYVFSDGARVPVPRSTRKHEKQLRRAQQSFDRKKKGSKNREKAKLRLQKKHKKVADTRYNWLHETTSLIANCEYVALEDLNVSGMVKNRRLAKSVSDASFGTFRRMLEYKTDVVLINRWFPSSKLCHSCGVVKTKLPLSVRTWTCECGVAHDRDLNAAINIIAEAKKQVNAGVSTVSACGEFSTSALIGTDSLNVSSLYEAGTTMKAGQ